MKYIIICNPSTIKLKLQDINKCSLILEKIKNPYAMLWKVTLYPGSYNDLTTEDATLAEVVDKQRK